MGFHLKEVCIVYLTTAQPLFRPLSFVHVYASETEYGQENCLSLFPSFSPLTEVKVIDCNGVHRRYVPLPSLLHPPKG